MPLAKPSTSTGRFVTFASLVLVVAVLRIAEEVMIPIALAFLLAFLLTPFVARLTRWRMPKPAAIIVTNGPPQYVAIPGTSLQYATNTDAPLFRTVDALRWDVPTDAFASWVDRLDAPRLLERCMKVRAKREASAGAA